MRRNTVVPLGRLAEHVAALGVDPRRVMYRRASARPMDFDVIVKVASSDLYVDNVLAAQRRGEHSPDHWNAFVRRVTP